MMRLLCLIALLLPAIGIAETVSITVTPPSRQVTVEQKSVVVTPTTVTVEAVVNVTGTDITTVAVPGSQGVKGDKGDRGDTGLQGPAGPAGATGATGPQGERGFRGYSGLPGRDGAQGPAGIAGPQGIRGADGLAGLTGPQGERGFRGYSGAQGPQGIQGIKGDTGATGPQGTQGTTGSTGPQGPTGAQGPRGYDGYDGSQIFTGAGAPGSGTGTASDYYLNSTNGDYYLKTGSPAAWTLQGNLKGPAGNNGTNGKTYSCAITGGVRTLEYDKNGANPAPTMVPFGVEMREDGSIVTGTCDWTTPASGSLLSGSSSTCSFTPTVAGTFVAATDNRVDVAVTYAGVTCRTTAPVPATKVGADGAQGSDNKAQIYAKIGAAATGDVLNTQCGSGDASTFAGRTFRVGSGDIHRTDLCGGSSWVHALSGDAAGAPKLGVKNSSGTALSYFTADGSLIVKGSITIK